MSPIATNQGQEGVLGVVSGDNQPPTTAWVTVGSTQITAVTEGVLYKATATEEDRGIYQAILQSSTAFRCLDVPLKEVSFVESVPHNHVDAFFAFILWTPGGSLGNQKTLVTRSEAERQQWIDLIQAARNPNGIQISPSPAVAPAHFPAVAGIKPTPTAAAPGGSDHVSVRSRHEAAQWLQDTLLAARHTALKSMRVDYGHLSDLRSREIARSVLDRLDQEGGIGVNYHMDDMEASSTHQSYFDDCTLDIATSTVALRASYAHEAFNPKGFSDKADGRGSAQPSSRDLLRGGLIAGAP